MFVGYELKKLKTQYPEIEVETIEVLFDFKRAWKDGIRIFPAVKIGKDMLAGLILSPKAVREFVETRLHASRISTARP